MGLFLNKHSYSKKISERYTSPHGDKEVPLYKIEVDMYGSDILVECGKHNHYSEIQSYKDETDLKKVMDMLGVDDSHEIVFNDEVMDLCRIPKNLGDWHNHERALSDYWNSLSPVVRADMGNNIHNLPSYLMSVHESIESAKAVDNSVKAVDNSAVKGDENNGN